MKTKTVKFIQTAIFSILLVIAINGSTEGGIFEPSQRLKLIDTSKKPVFTADISDVTSLVISPDSKIIYAGLSNGKVVAYDINQSTSIPLDINCDATPVLMAVHPNGRLLAVAAYGGKIELWDIKGNTKLMHLSGVSEYPSSLCFSSNGSMIMATYAYGDHVDRNGEAELGLNPIMIWDTGSGKLIRRFDGHGFHVRDAKFSADGNFVFSAGYMGGNDFIQWDINTGKVIKKFTGGPRDFIGISISQDNTIVTGFMQQGKIMQWDTQMPDKPVKIYDMEDDTCSVFRCSLDGSIAVIGTGSITVFPPLDVEPFIAIPSNVYVKVFDIKGKRKLVSLSHKSIAYIVDLSTDGHTLASYTDKDYVRVWRLKFDLK